MKENTSQLISSLFEAIKHKDLKKIEELIKKDLSIINMRNNNGWSPLNTAASKGNLEVVKLLIEEGKAEINQLNEDASKVSALWIAAQKGHVDIVRYLLDKGADYTIQSANYGRTALHIAVKQDKIEVVKILMTKLDLLTITNKFGHTVLHSAAFGHFDILKLLIEENKVDINQLDNNEFKVSALWIAAQEGHVNIVQYLLDRDADYRIQSANDGRTALHQAIQKDKIEVVKILMTKLDLLTIPNKFGDTALHSAALGHFDILQLLIEGGKVDDINQLSEDAFKVSALWIAAQEGYVNIVQYLLEKGADYTIQSAHGGRTALHQAIQKDKIEVVRLLMTKLDLLTITNKSGHTALHSAAFGHFDILKLLIEGSKVDINQLDKNEFKVSALWIAAQEGHVDIVQYLLDRGADYRIQSANDGRTALHQAIQKDKIGVVRLLMTKLDLLTIPNKFGNTPLHTASSIGKTEIIKILIKGGANIEAKGKDGITPLNLAVSQGHMDAVKCLIELGANVNSMDARGRTPLAIAEKKGGNEMVAFLKQVGAVIDVKKNSPDNNAETTDAALNISDTDIDNMSVRDGALDFKVIDLADTCYNKGIDLYNLGKKEEAIECYDLAIWLNSNDATVYNNKGNALDDLGKSGEAIICYDIAIKLRPDDVAAYNNKGNALTALNRNEEAISCYDKAIELNLNDTIAYYNKGNALYDLGEYEKAISCYDKAIELNLNYSDAYYNKAIALTALNRNEEVISCYDKAIELNPNDTTAYYNKGNALYDLGKNEEAISCYDIAIKLNPKHAAAYYNKGLALGKNEEAISYYDMAIKLNPYEVIYLCSKGKILSILGKVPEASECFNEAYNLIQSGDLKTTLSVVHVNHIKEILFKYKEELSKTPTQLQSITGDEKAEVKEPNQDSALARQTIEKSALPRGSEGKVPDQAIYGLDTGRANTETATLLFQQMNQMQMQMQTLIQGIEEIKGEIKGEIKRDNNKLKKGQAKILSGIHLGFMEVKEVQKKQAQEIKNKLEGYNKEMQAVHNKAIHALKNITGTLKHKLDTYKINSETKKGMVDCINSIMKKIENLPNQNFIKTIKSEITELIKSGAIITEKKLVDIESRVDNAIDELDAHTMQIVQMKKSLSLIDVITRALYNKVETSPLTPTDKTDTKQKIKKLSNDVKKIVDSVADEDPIIMKLVKEMEGLLQSKDINSRSPTTLHKMVKKIKEQVESSTSENNSDTTEEKEEKISGGGFTVMKDVEIYWNHYTKVAMDKMLMLRISEALDLRQTYKKDEADKTDKVEIISPDYIWDDSVGTAIRLSNTIAEVLLDMNRGSILLYMSLYNKHWVGLVINKSTDHITASYLDSEGQKMPKLLKVQLTHTLEIIFPNFNVKLSERVVELQQYDNCGPETIENLLPFIGISRIPQDEVVNHHSALLEQQLLIGESFIPT